jgi:hypothetical protein
MYEAMSVWLTMKWIAPLTHQFNEMSSFPDFTLDEGLKYKIA